MRAYHALCLFFYGGTGITFLLVPQWVGLVSYDVFGLPWFAQTWALLFVVVGSLHLICLTNVVYRRNLVYWTGLLTIFLAGTMFMVSAIISLPIYHDINAPMFRLFLVALHIFIWRNQGRMYANLNKISAALMEVKDATRGH